MIKMMKQKNVIQVLVGGFPFMLAAAVLAGLVFYYFGPSDFGMAAARSNGDSELVRAVPVSEAGVAANLKIFSEVLGARDPGDLVAQNRAGKYLDSTLGIRNTGYRVRRPLAGIEGLGWTVLEVEVPGVRKPNEVVVVNGSFDTTASGGGDSSGVAVLLSVARAMVGATPERTVRFVFDVKEADVRERYAAALREEGVRVVEFIEIGESLAGEISVGQAVGYAGVKLGKRRRISGEVGGDMGVEKLAEVASQIESTILLAGRSQK